MMVVLAVLGTGLLGWLARPGSLALGSDPGSADDPLLTQASLRQRLDTLTAAERQQLDSLEDRLKSVAAGLQKVQQALQDSSFPDLKGARGEAEVGYLRSRGVIGGYPDGLFHPDYPVTRAALAVMLTRSLQLKENPSGAGFKDLNADHWAAGAVGAAREAGYLQGYPDGTFRPDRSVTRGEVAALLNKAFKVASGQETDSFKDLTGHWAADSIKRLAAAGVLEGYQDGTFRPDLPMTRLDVAVALARLLQQKS